MTSKFLKRTLWFLVIVFVLMNVVAVFHAYKFTHFAESGIAKTKDARKQTKAERLKTLVFGVSNPRPANDREPGSAFETIRLQSNCELECWSMKADSSKGTVVFFHGYGGKKCSMLDRAAVFQQLGYNTLLVDFMGSGGSEGKQTTIGYAEAEEVKTCYDYLQAQGEKNIYLFGTSMGAAAVMKAMSDYELNPSGIIVECPFGTMYKTVCARFKTMGAPVFPMAGLLVFWGGAQNGFWAFGHNPAEYASSISCPTLLMYGGQDEKVSREETDEIFKNLKGEKRLKVFDECGHESYLTKYEPEWTQEVKEFLSEKE